MSITLFCFLAGARSVRLGQSFHTASTFLAGCWLFLTFSKAWSLPIQLDSTQRSVSGGRFFPQSFHHLAFQCWVFCDGGPEPWLSGNVSHFQKKSTGDCSLNLISQIRIRFSHPKWSKKLSCIHILCIYLLGRTLWQLFEIYIYIYFTYVFYIYHFNICKCVITFKILHLNICVEGLGDRKK